MKQRKNESPFAIIIGLATMQGLQAARILACHGIPVIAIASDPKHFSCQTNVCREILIADTKSEEFINLLETIGPGLDGKAVLYPCRDESVLQLSRHRQRLEEWYHFLLPEQDTVELLIDKSRFYQFAQENNHPIPRTFAINNPSDLALASQLIKFPGLLKPPCRTDKWSQHTAFKAFKVSSREELHALYQRCHGWSDSFVLQEWVEGTDEDLFSCNCYFDANSNPLVTFVARKIRQWPPETGESSLGQECRNDEVLHESIRLFKNVGFKGLGYLEMKCDRRSGRHYIIEPNIGRPTGRSAISEAGGVELLYTMYCELLGLPLPVNREQNYSNVKWVHLTRDCASALHYWRNGQLTLKDWLGSLRGKKVFAVFSLTDPKPFWADILRALKILLSRKEQNRRKPVALGGAIDESSKIVLNEQMPPSTGRAKRFQ